MNLFIALLKREVLEHKNLWKVPVILLGIAILVRLAFSFGNLSIDIDVPNAFNFESTIDSVLQTALGKTLSGINSMITLVMFLVAIFYSLSSLFDERQDQSVLFWRSLPISDTETILSKLAIALVVVPIVILVLQSLVAIVFLGFNGFTYLAAYLSSAVVKLGEILLWSMLPVISWCLLCSQIAKKNPFLLAFVTPIIFMLVDNLFLNGVVSETFVINRLTGVDEHSFSLMVWGVIFSAACLAFAIAKRGERF